MPVSEAEAKTKWCPFVRASNAASGTWNRSRNEHVSDDVYYNCIGSHCMAWKWFDKTTGRGSCGLTVDHKSSP